MTVDASPSSTRTESPTLRGKVLFVTGATRGIGRAIALRAARDGAFVAVVGKTREPHPALPGTVVSTCREVEAAGGEALPCVVDVRDDDAVERAVQETAAAFGGIDILVNNASAIALLGTQQITMRRYDLLQQVNARATFLCSRLCIPWLQAAQNPHILTLSPPLSLQPNWFSPHLAYTMSKYGMSLCTLGLAAELAPLQIAVNSLWPRTTIATAAIANMPDGEQLLTRSRKPEIVADAAHAILTTTDCKLTGQFLIDENVLRSGGCTSFDNYAVDTSQPLQSDLFLDASSVDPGSAGASVNAPPVRRTQSD